jgi:hypothetical protein
MVFRILLREFRAKARAEGPRGNRALRGMLADQPPCNPLLDVLRVRRPPTLPSHVASTQGTGGVPGHSLGRSLSGSGRGN